MGIGIVHIVSVRFMGSAKRGSLVVLLALSPKLASLPSLSPTNTLINTFLSGPAELHEDLSTQTNGFAGPWAKSRNAGKNKLELLCQSADAREAVPWPRDLQNGSLAYKPI